VGADLREINMIAILLTESGYVPYEIEYVPQEGWRVSYTWQDSLGPSRGSFKAEMLVDAKRMIGMLPLMVHPEAEEVLWANYVPQHGPAKVGKVHLRNPGAKRTVCGVEIAHVTRQFPPTRQDIRCSRCEKKKRVM
jgi:hypothetical protein